jgi:hypothetical protein
MKTLLDEILSHEAPGKPHTGGCGCASCADKAKKTAFYPYWKERRQKRLGLNDAHTASCGCTKCQSGQQSEFEYGDDDFHTFWRRRRQLRHDWPLDVEILLETPIVQLVSLSDQPVPTLPLHREFELLMENEEEYSKNPSTVRIVYVYQENKGKYCKRPGWQKSERDVLRLYQAKYPTTTAQGAYYRGRPINRARTGSTKPDAVLPSGAQSLDGMRLPRSIQAELEVVEVKHYKIGNIPSLFARLTRQINARKSINVPGGEQGKYQSVVLDFRGQENRCDEIKAAAKRVKDRLRDGTKGIVILVQVLLWKGPGCAKCQGQTQTF